MISYDLALSSNTISFKTLIRKVPSLARTLFLSCRALLVTLDSSPVRLQEPPHSRAMWTSSDHLSRVREYFLHPRVRKSLPFQDLGRVSELTGSCGAHNLRKL